MKQKVIELLSINDFPKLEAVMKTLSNDVYVLVIANTKQIKESELKKWLSKCELIESNTYKSVMAKINFMIARVIVNLVFYAEFEKNVEKIIFKRDDYHKPFITNNRGIHFNISHTNGYVIVGFAKREIGVDIEKINKSFQYKDILDICFTSREINIINDNYFTFFKYWTAKEAYLKYIGKGLIRDLREIEILDDDKQMINIYDHKERLSKILKPLSLDERYIGTICL